MLDGAEGVCVCVPPAPLAPPPPSPPAAAPPPPPAPAPPPPPAGCGMVQKECVSVLTGVHYSRGHKPTPSQESNTLSQVLPLLTSLSGQSLKTKYKEGNK